MIWGSTLSCYFKLVLLSETSKSYLIAQNNLFPIFQRLNKSSVKPFRPGALLQGSGGGGAIWLRIYPFTSVAIGSFEISFGHLYFPTKSPSSSRFWSLKPFFVSCTKQSFMRISISCASIVFPHYQTTFCVLVLSTHIGLLWLEYIYLFYWFFLRTRYWTLHVFPIILLLSN